MAGFTGVFKIGWNAGTLASIPDPISDSIFEDSIVFGVGASGLAAFASSTGSAGAGDFSSMTEGAAGLRGVSAEGVLQQKSTSAAMINAHLSRCRPGQDAWLAATIPILLY